MVCDALQKVNVWFLVGSITVVLLLALGYAFVYGSWYVTIGVVSIIAVPVVMGMLEVFMGSDAEIHARRQRRQRRGDDKGE